ncbi:hypothetical protein FHX49_000605 [Microbacterium endophyticum]|uniref:Uncharacterized protein n=1 Tax=Microbacterium endophyticum TaxID=1526412 RepID=A0A7W4V1Z1_9MICO|nr:hypothetical protein [Microbacterium endophyticum]NIK37396.1 hypothetical protein [Microbacterium endophyticum]
MTDIDSGRGGVSRARRLAWWIVLGGRCIAVVLRIGLSGGPWSQFFRGMVRYG